MLVRRTLLGFALFSIACTGADESDSESEDTEDTRVTADSLEKISGDWEFLPGGDVCTPHFTCVQWFTLTVSDNGEVDAWARMQLTGGFVHGINMEGDAEAIGPAFAFTFTSSNEDDGEPVIPAMSCQLSGEQLVCLADTYESNFVFDRD